MYKLCVSLMLFAFCAQGQFKKTTLTNEFLCEGANFGDLNGDGVNDIAAGSFWYEGPDFQKRHQIRELRKGGPIKITNNAYDPHKYSNEFFTWIRDINKDGKNDILIAGLPGTPLYAYLNPGSADGKWAEHSLFDVVDNESPELVDMDGDGTEELICNFDGYFGYAKMNPDKPLDKWTWYPVSKKGKWHRYTHGIGAGDVNNDGKMDMIAAHGWYKQPEKIEKGKQWKFFPYTFASRGAQVWAYDVDGDGKNDVISAENAHGYGLSWYRYIGENKYEKNVLMGSKEEHSPYGLKFSQLHALQLIDMDGDGLKDLVTGKRYWAHGPNGDDEPMAPAVLYWFKLVRENGKAKFVPNKIDDDSGVGTQLVVGDVNGDKKPDVVVGNKKGVYLFTNEVSVNTSMAYNFEKTNKKEEGFVKIFDGSSFNGWEGDKKWFRIADGAIVAGKSSENIPHNFFLATEKDYYNFELRLQVKMDHSINNNGGIQIRSSRIPNHHEMKGYQADVGMKYWGHIYDESRRKKFIGAPAPFSEVQKVLKSDWNDYTIICKDNKVKTYINGFLVSDYSEDDAEIAKVTGKIAVQIHGGKALEIFYKNIRIKELK
ncbi:MAG: DUF1080 domain-containing protein [Lentisphaeraceae bacterium]|nr:DUF1080 domain-containing protein [Lentisphaeraceae bacterium]